MWKAILFGLAIVPILLAVWMKYAVEECKSFDVDYHAAANKIVIVTGANSGLGFHTALALARANATVVLACRNERKCIPAKLQIQAAVPSSKVDSLELDLSSFKSIKQFTEDFKKKFPKLDVLINNAGIMAVPSRELTVDGLELQIGTNHFGHFLLTALLYPILSNNGRIINHSSGAHALADKNFPLEDLQSERDYSPFKAYGNSKLANLLFTFELNKRLKESGNPRNISSIAVHPGYTATNLQVERFPFWEQLNALFAMSGKDGSLSQIYGKCSYRDPWCLHLIFGVPCSCHRPARCS
jgi:NAD(P)-dependent dehydrogenase (short-subunit alcohol dehydrogenase family)